MSFFDRLAGRLLGARVERKVDRLLEKLDRLEVTLSQAVETLRAEIAENRTISQSAVTLIKGLAQQIRDNAEDPEALRALAAELDTQNADLAAAVAENTPAEKPVEAPAPETPPVE
jgi:TolA-binding protein